MSLPQVDHPSAFTGELQRASFAPNAVPQLGQPSGYLSSSGQYPSHAGSSSGQHSQSGMSHHGVPSVAGPQGQLSQSSPSHSNPGLSHPGLSHPGLSHPGLSHHAHPGHSHPDHSRPSHPHSSHSYPGNAYSHPGNPYTSSGHVAAVGGLPRVGPGVSSSDDHSSQPSVSSSLAHASVSHPYSTQPQQSSDNTSRKLTMVALGIAAAAGGLAALLYVGLGKPTRPTDATSAPASTAVTAPTEEPSSTISTAEATAPATDPTADPGAIEAKLEIKVKPSNAEISLDGAKLGSGVLKTTIPRDGKEHELTVDAPGYASKTRKIKPEETFIFWEPELSLQRGGGPIPRATNTATSEPTSTVRRDRNGKIIRDIERDYPGGG